MIITKGFAKISHLFNIGVIISLSKKLWKHGILICEARLECMFRLYFAEAFQGFDQTRQVLSYLLVSENKCRTCLIGLYPGLQVL